MIWIVLILATTALFMLLCVIGERCWSGLPPQKTGPDVESYSGLKFDTVRSQAKGVGARLPCATRLSIQFDKRRNYRWDSSLEL